MHCELCGQETNEPFTCQICGKKVCLECVRIITRPAYISVPPSTIPVYPTASTFSIPVTLSFNSSISDEDIIICKSCADLLKLTLRVTKAKYEKDYNG